VEQLSKDNECIVLLFCFLCFLVVAISLVATDMICLHDVALMYLCVESAYGEEGGALGQHTWHR
jgi:hypothetical protein